MTVAVEPRIDAAAAERAVSFISHLKHTKGDWAGKRFILEPWQRDEIIIPLFGTLNPDGMRQYRYCYVEIPRKNGKALAIDTPIPTPNGWTTIGDCKKGDVVFNERGEQCNIIATTRIQNGRPCYKVSFSDGTYLIADKEHEWLTSCHVNGLNGHKREGFHYGQSVLTRVRTTKEILQTLHYGKRQDRNHSIKLSQPLQLPDTVLPIPPYVLGAWLGDGNSRSARFTCNDSDIQIIEELRKEGIEAKGYSKFEYWLGGKGRTWAPDIRKQTLQYKLRELNLLKNKHIPLNYLRASYKQRLSLMQGLMDTDGFVSPRGQCEIVTIYPRLLDGVLDLLRGLGFKPSVNTQIAKCNGKNCGECYRIQFFAFDDVPIARLIRKVHRQKARPPVAARSETRQIVDVQEIPSVPVKCIQVDSPSQLYLAGEGMIPTHNSELGAAIALYLLFADGEIGAEIYSAAGEKGQASLVFNVGAQMVRYSPALMKRSKIIDSQKRIVNYQTGSFYSAISAEAYSKFGYNAHGIIFDELHTQPDRDLWDVLTTSTGARSQPLIFAITTAGYDRHSICWEQHDYACKVRDGIIDDPTFLPVIYAAPEDADWQDENAWFDCNPALGVFRSLDEMRNLGQKAKENPALEMVFRRLYLDQWTNSVERWMPMEKWDECDEEISDLEGRDCYAGLDLSATTDLTALALVFPDGDSYDVLMHFWIPEDTMREKERKDRVPYSTWVKRGYVTATPGNVIDYHSIQHKLEEYAELYNVKEVAFDRWGATKLSQDLTDAGFTMVPFGQGFASMAAPTKELMTLVLSGKIRHGGNPVLRWNADNMVVKTDPAGNLKPDKEKATQKIDGVVAFIMGLDRATRHSEMEGVSVYDERGLATV